MAELVVGPLLFMLKDKASNYLLEQYKVMDGMKEQREILKRKLPAILDIIQDAEEKGAYRPGVCAWLEALKNVANEANNVFDEFKYEVLRRDAKKKGQYKKLGFDIVSLFPAHNPIVFRCRMGKKLCKIVHTIEDIVSRSRNGEKKIVNVLVDQARDRGLISLPIVGINGLGKTTFAQLVYNDPEIKEYFQLQRWCCVSDDFNVAKIASNIFQTNEMDREKALQNLQKELSQKRCLVVLDDMCIDDSHNLGKLHKVFLKEILENRAFCLQKPNAVEPELSEVVEMILDRCVGSPLAAKAFGSMLSTKTSMKEWSSPDTVVSYIRSWLSTTLVEVQSSASTGILWTEKTSTSTKALTAPEYVTEEDAKACSLGNKEKLACLSLEWSNYSNRELDQHRSVLDALQPHVALELLKINSYEGIGFPTWVTSPNFLQHLTELCLDGCTMCEEFPQFGQYKSLEVLILKRLSKLQSLCSHSSSTTFPTLKYLTLENLENFERWVASKGEYLTFPVLKNVKIENCPKLMTLPEAPKLKVIELAEEKAQLCLSIFRSRHVSCLSDLSLCVNDTEAKPTLELDQDREVSLSELRLHGCSFLFCSSPSQPTFGVWK
ncbi:putative disease resistance protein RGA1 [Triticum aestivum]|uniref:putative disease resistance protein RGA1 n=1 Tax=Triticum aestivum TaxID=4565 RepID=UPI001D0173DC|nr:putative disease resistance protein RGA1 [Triticum aestivum]